MTYWEEFHVVYISSAPIHTRTTSILGYIDSYTDGAGYFFQFKLSYCNVLGIILQRADFGIDILWL